MKLVHISDLHFGKSIHGINLIDEMDQPFWVDGFLDLMKKEKPSVIMISGDVYDRSAPSNEAVRLLDRMLTSLAEELPETSVMIIAGNHDSGQRLSFGNSLFKKQNLYISGILEKELDHVTLQDEYGPVTFWLLPYVFPALVNQVLGEEFRDYDSAMRAMLKEQPIDFTQRNVLIAHQNVLASGKEAERGGSETMVGGVGAIDYTAFDGFDYVALGHIHAAQPMGREEVRYAGSPMCYHFSETKRPSKGPVVIELGAKGEAPAIEIKTVPILHPMREVRGTLQEIIDTESDLDRNNEYIRVVLTEGRRSPDDDAAITALFESKGSMVLEIAIEVQEYVGGEGYASSKAVQEKSVEDLFYDFWIDRRGESPDEKDTELLSFIAEQMRNTQKDQSEPTDKQIQAIIDFASGLEV